jgi:hypothetical protein
MAMLLSCDNSGCGYSDYHRLDEATNDVICTKCGKPVGVSSYAKTALKSMKQVVKTVKSDFGMSCDNCNALDAPALKMFGKTTTKVVCKQCGVVNEHLSKYFVEALKLRPGIEVTHATPEELAALGIKGPNRFNPAQTTQVQSDPTTVVVTAPEDISDEPTKVEYYPWPEGEAEAEPTTVAASDEANGIQVQAASGAVVVQPTSDEPINVDKLKADRVKPVIKPTKVVAGEDQLRKRIENMPGGLTTHQQPAPPGLNMGDMARGGVLDYAGDVED